MRDAALEFLAFGLKQVRACTFVGLFFAAVFSMPRAGAFGIPRYDLLLLYAVVVQAGMVLSKLETFDEPPSGLGAACDAERHDRPTAFWKVALLTLVPGT